MYTHMHPHMHTHMLTHYARTHAGMCACTCVCMCMCTCTCICMYTCVYAPMHTHACTHTCMQACTCVHVCVCMCAHENSPVNNSAVGLFASKKYNIAIIDLQLASSNENSIWPKGLAKCPPGLRDADLACLTPGHVRVWRLSRHNTLTTTCHLGPCTRLVSSDLSSRGASYFDFINRLQHAHRESNSQNTLSRPYSSTPHYCENYFYTPTYSYLATAYVIHDPLSLLYLLAANH